MGGSNWITNSFSLFFFLPNRLILLSVKKDLKRLHGNLPFFYIYFSRLCAFTTVGSRPSLFKKFRHVRVKLDDSFWMRQSYIYALACELIILNDPQELHKNERLFFYFLLPRVFYYSIAICIFLSFFFCTWFVFDNGGPEMLGEKVIGISRFSC